MQDQVLTYDGREYRIPARDLMRLICGVEDIITLIEIQEVALRGTMKLGKIARAYAYILNWVGVPVTELEVYYKFFVNLPGEEVGKNLERVGTIIKDIIGLMAPPEHFKQKLAADSGNRLTPARESGDTSRNATKPGSHGDTPRKTSGRRRRKNSGG